LKLAALAPLEVTAVASGVMHALAVLTVAWTMPVWPKTPRERVIEVSVEATTPPAAQPGAPHPEPDITQAIPPPEEAPPLDVATDFPPPPALPPQQVEPAPPATMARLEEALAPVEEPPPFSTRELVHAVPAPPPRQPPDSRPGARPEPAHLADSGRPSRRLAREDYLAAVIEKLSRYRFVPSAQPAHAQAASAHGVVVMRVTVARDGNVLDVVLLRSSGFATLDQGLVGTVHRASPFAPLPPELQASQLSFTVPLAYDVQR